MNRYHNNDEKIATLINEFNIDAHPIRLLSLFPQTVVSSTFFNLFLNIGNSAFESIHPRRSCDAFAMATLQQNPWTDNHYPKFDTLEELQEWMMPLIKEEVDSEKLSSKGNT